MFYADLFIFQAAAISTLSFFYFLFYLIFKLLRLKTKLTYKTLIKNIVFFLVVSIAIMTIGDYLNDEIKKESLIFYEKNKNTTKSKTTTKYNKTINLYPKHQGNPDMYVRLYNYYYAHYNGEIWDEQKSD